MMFNKVRLVGYGSVLLPIQNLDPSSPYILKNIEGLGPPDIDTSIIQSLYQGGTYQNSRPQGREVIVRIRLNPNYAIGQTVADLRTELYRQIIIDPTFYSRIELWNDVEVVAQVAKCYIKRFEIVPFNKETEVQITYSCVSPYLVRADLTYVDTNTLDKAYPYINNIGSAPTGVHLELIFTANVSVFTVATAVNQARTMIITYPFLTNDRLIIDTAPGFKKVDRIRNNAKISLIGSVSTTDYPGDTPWIFLEPGDNNFTITPPAQFNWDVVYFKTQYWGV